jgi:hypothetical protein
VALTDGSGNVTATYAYDAFGAVRSQTGCTTNPWQFTGQQLDAESALYFRRPAYDRARCREVGCRGMLDGAIRLAFLGYRLLLFHEVGCGFGGTFGSIYQSPRRMHPVERRSAIRLIAVTSLLVTALLVLTAPVSSQESVQSSSKVFLPVVFGASPGCQPIAGVSYGTLNPNPPPLDMSASSDPDINIELRGWQPTTGTLGLVNYNGSADANAPQLNGLFTDNRLPTFTAVYQVYNWNWTTNTRGSLITNPSVTLAGLQVQPGEVIQAPPSGYDIGSGYTALVLYATTNQITLTYTRNDSIVSGYAVHIDGVCVEPTLLALYQQMNNAGRGRLPALYGRQPLGRANGAQIDVAIRDSGTFMDPRSQKDWWQAY